MFTSVINVFIILDMMDSQHHCDVCGKKFHRQDNYINHKKVHENGLDCDVCQKPHTSLEDLVVHIERVHNPKIGYDCVVCQKPHRHFFFINYDQKENIIVELITK